jgi:DNA polymerase zeta
MGLSFDMCGYISTESRDRSTKWNNEESMKDRYDQVLQADASQTVQTPDICSIPTSFEAIEVFAQRQALLVSLHTRSPHGRPSLSQAEILSIKKFDDDRELFIASQRSTASVPPWHSRRFASASNADLSRTVQPSSVARHFLVQRLRGGAHFAYKPPPAAGTLSPDRLEHINSAFPAPHYSDPNDVPTISHEYHGVAPKSYHPLHVPVFLPRTGQARARTWAYTKLAPTAENLDKTWSPSRQRLSRLQASQVIMPTQHLSGTPSRPVSQADVPLSVLSIEMHAQSRGGLLPNPSADPVLAIYWAFEDLGLGSPIQQGCFLSTQELPNHLPERGIEFVDSELDLLNALIGLVRNLDPDIVMSFEMQNSSIGYLHERAHIAFSIDLCEELGRFVPSDKMRQVFHDRWGETTATSVKIAGRHVLNLWRVMRGEMNLLQYTLENICFHLLKRRLPKYEVPKLQIWLSSNSASSQQRVLRYYTLRTRLNLEIVEVQGLLSRVSEQARLLGIDFYSVFSRGSQFKVESLMFRIAKPECFMLLSPSRKQVAQQNALECLPLVMEPQSHFYHDPIVVLDFTSLYPSIVIAYNFCYSTCLGKLGYGGLEPKLGVSYYQADGSLRQALKDDVEIAPNGVVYAKEDSRKSLLAKMLTDLLETRAMVKQGMKLTQDKRLQKLMHNRQLALKLIANVTYGYTSASFSGRMPCSDIADSIVQTGRETLEMAIEYIHAHPKWHAEVVYGDTDSLFIKLPGRSREEAFDLGHEMAKAITLLSPSPVSLKFEKVYLPCILLAKKRYVGFKHESLKEAPVFEAKGIETVRRDGTPAEQKIEEKALRILFTTGDISQVKRYFQEECWKIMIGKCSLHDFCFAKEVKLGHYSTKGVPPPGAVISARSIARDPRSEPQYGERVPYLVISGAARSRLTDRCVAPEELLHNPDLRLDVDYYITKNIIPPLERLFSIMGVQVRSWYDEMPRSKIDRGKQTGIMAQFLSSSHCPVCRQDQNKPGICASCLSKPNSTQFDLTMAARAHERVHRDLLAVCASCCRQPQYAEIACVSKDCPVYYKRTRSQRTVDIEALLRSQIS